MKKAKETALVITGVIAGAMLASPTAQAAAEKLNVQRSSQTFFVDGETVKLEAYNINGYNYIKLGDLSPLVGFQLTYDSTTNSVYIGEKPIAQDALKIPQSDQKLSLKTGDTVLCDDGTHYEIKDMSRYDNNVFAAGPVGDLPSATCDWSLFPDTVLPDADVRHFSNGTGDTLFIRNLYETRRMEYTIYNALGAEPSAWDNGTPLATVELSIPGDLEAYTSSFWPWRASELEKLVHSRPNSRYYVEAWDYYLNGVFQYTRYCVTSQ